jgi:type I restriction enzyme S subunit
MREYRTRLIADVVTGKVDVRGVALPEGEDGEAEAPDVAGDADDGDDPAADADGPAHGAALGAEDDA